MPPRYSLIKKLGLMLVMPVDKAADAYLSTLVLQDYILKLQDLKDTLKYIDQQIDIYPIWLCPTRHVVWPGLEEVSPFDPQDCHVDIGVYG